MGSLDGMVALVTGAGSAEGQGAAEARLFAAAGASVVITDLPTSAGERIAAEIGDHAAFMPLDVTDADAWQRCVEATTRRYGKLDILVNNAGVWLDAGVSDTTPDQYRAVVEVNQVGVFLGMHTVVPVMLEQGAGSVVNVCSNAGMQGSGMPHAYAASKWAVRGMTLAAAAELAPGGIRVNALCPGVIDTPMITGGEPVLTSLAAKIPAGRVGSPEEVAYAALFLASPSASYISGAILSVDGAVTA